jgi:hypothetical protein
VMIALTVALLGGFDVRLSSGTALSLPTKKSQALLAYLGLRPGQTHQRDNLPPASGANTETSKRVMVSATDSPPYARHFPTLRPRHCSSKVRPSP